MKLKLKNKTRLFIITIFLSSVAFLINGCSSGPGYVPAGSNNTCSQNLSNNMKKLLNCPSTTSSTTITLPKPIVIANGGTYAKCPAIPNTGLISVVVTATDFQTNAPVPATLVSFFTTTSNTVNGSQPDFTVTTGQSGTVSASLPTGTPFVAEGSVAGYKDTYQFGEILSASDAGAFLPVLLISGDTVNLISALAHVQQDWSNGAIAGTIEDCSGNPIQNVTISVVNAKTGITVTTDMTYFKPSSSLGDIPDPAATLTSSDGIFVALNTPPGDYYVVAHGVLPNSNVLTELGKSYAESIKNAVSIANLQPPTAP